MGNRRTARDGPRRGTAVGMKFSQRVFAALLAGTQGARCSDHWHRGHPGQRFGGSFLLNIMVPLLHRATKFPKSVHALLDRGNFF